MTAPAFTILLPVHRPPALLPYAIASVLAQDRQDFELFIICDGAPPETVSCAEGFAARDRRILVFAHPKGESKGEVYRHQALKQARGTYVCHIGDDDLWFPNHLAEMAALLRDVDFGNLPQIEAQADGSVFPLLGNLAKTDTRQRMIAEIFNFFGPTVAGYRLSAYRALPNGWTPAPLGVPTDLHMWRQFLAQIGFRFGTRIAISSLKFPASTRSVWTMEQRATEIAAWAEKLSHPDGRDMVAQIALGHLNNRVFALQARIEQLDELARNHAEQDKKMRDKLRATRATLSWRVTRPFRRVARIFLH